MRVLDQPITSRIDPHSPSLGNPVMLFETPHAPDAVEWMPSPVVIPPPDPIEAALARVHAEIFLLRADLESRTWLARWRRLWHRLSSWRIRQPAIREPLDR